MTDTELLTIHAALQALREDVNALLKSESEVAGTLAALVGGCSATLTRVEALERGTKP